MKMDTANTLEGICIESAKKYFPYSSGIFKKETAFIKAVDDVSLDIRKGETIGLVGESGSGKTTLARLVLGLENLTDGSIKIENIELATAKRRDIKEVAQKISIVFQDPASSLNPRRNVGWSITRPFIAMGNSKKAAVKKAKELLEIVQLDPSLIERYPHQLSGGQQQRMSIARALITEPDIMVLDEPTSALDISIQAQILNLLIKLQQDFDLTYLFITHDLNVVRYISDRIAVMYLGKIVEYGDVDALFDNPSHPYTVGLLNSSPVTNPRNRNEKKLILKGEPDSMINLPKGCRLTSRCPFVIEECRKKVPDFIDVGNGHHVSCIRAREIKELIK